MHELTVDLADYADPRDAADLVMLLDAYASDPMGGGGRAHEIVMIKKCPAPVHLSVTGEGHLNCFPPKPPGPRDAMSPTFDPY